MKPVLVLTFLTAIAVQSYAFDLNGLNWLDSYSSAGSPSVRLEWGSVMYFDPAQLKSFPDSGDADYIFISHPHRDHCDASAISRLLKDDTLIITNQAVFDALKDDFDEDRFFILNIGDVKQVGYWSVSAVPAYETNSSDHRKSEDFSGFIIDNGGERLYYSGDAGYMEEFTGFPEISVAVVCIRSAPPVLLYNDLSRFAETVGPEMLIPVHWLPADRYAVQRKAGDFPEDVQLVIKDRIR